MRTKEQWQAIHEQVLKKPVDISIKDFLKTLGAGYAGYINAKHVHKLGTVKSSKPEGKFVSFVPANSNGYVKIEFKSGTVMSIPKEDKETLERVITALVNHNV